MRPALMRAELHIKGFDCVFEKPFLGDYGMYAALTWYAACLF